MFKKWGDEYAVFYLRPKETGILYFQSQQIRDNTKN